MSQFSAGLTEEDIKRIIDSDTSMNYDKWDTLLKISIIDDS